MDKHEKRWTGLAKDLFVGRTVTSVEYLTQDEADQNGWFCRPLAIHLASRNGKEDGVWVYAMRDDEGNDAGALATTDKKTSVFPVFHKI
tara:strand:- start:99 stop:365 length:267 start_codon:yes stop_codon:yes gene_type:complete